MKPSSQYRSDIGDTGPLPRGSNQLISGITATAAPHLVYLTQHPSHHAPGYSSQGSTGSPHHNSRDYHGHHIQPSELQHRSHAGSVGIGTHSQLHPASMPQRRRPSGHRLSLLRDIGVAGERERDRTESSVSGSLSHGYTATTAGTTHIIPGPHMYGGRPTMTMMSSLGGLQPVQKALPHGSVSPQPSSGTQRHVPSSSGQHSRSSSLHAYSGSSGPFMLPGPSAIKSEPGVSSYIKEDSKPMHGIGAHYPPPLIPSAAFGLQSQNSASAIKSEHTGKETENMPSKESLVQSMEKVDKEIGKVTSEIKTLERKKQLLESAAKKPPATEKTTSPKRVETKHKDLWQVIYAENKRKAEAARGLLDHLCPRYDMPLYNQPSDTKAFQENLKKNEEMKPKLLAYFQRRCQLSNIRERYLCTRYDVLMAEWQKKADTAENSVKRKAKESKDREFFEKQFPEIRKQREQQERFTRSGTRGDACRSEADFNEIVDGLTEQEHQEQHMRQLAVVPPMLLDRDERRLKFINNNGLVTDPMEDYKKRQELDHWSAQEKQIFKEKYILHPKNFHAIASFLEKKNVADCVLFYYLSKKGVGYKALVRKNSLKPRKVKSGRGHHAQQSAASSSAHDASKSGQLSEKMQGDKESDLKDSLVTVVKEEEIERIIDRPPSPRITRSKNKSMNWTDEDISTAKEGFGKHGKDFAAISRLFANKSELQIKNFYHNYKKKHNLDQLISDGKKKKPEGGRRTRTQAPASEPQTVSPVEEPSVKNEPRPQSADPQIPATEAPESTKKRKKDSDVDSKEDLKGDSIKKGEATPPLASEIATSATSQIRTRRSVATGGTEASKTQPAKRTSEAQPLDEPAEKKAKKSKSGKEIKAEQKEVPPVLEQPASSSNDGKNIKMETDVAEDVPATEEIPEKATPVSTASIDPVISVKSEVASTSSPMSVIASTTTVQQKPTSSDQSKQPSVPSAPALLVESTAAPKVPQPVNSSSKTQSGRENDGDSSATCSADEEPNMQEVDFKVAPRKHADSPYAFEDESSASIKLETNRSTISPATAMAAMKQPLPARTTPVEVNRPASTHPPQVANLKQDQKRPQSLPPPPGAVPISTLTFNPNSSQKSNKTGHCVGRVPEASEFHLMLQNVSAPGNTMPPRPQLQLPDKPQQKESVQTIDLTGSISSTEPNDRAPDRPRQAPTIQALPHYHPVSQEALSLQKDFTAAKVPPPPHKEDIPPARPREYTPMDIAAMKDRSAAIPVSSLRVPMPGYTSRKDEYYVKKEGQIGRSDAAGISAYAKPIPIHTLHQPVLVQNQIPASVSRSILTTSSVPTKFVSGTMTSGVPVRQNPLAKPSLPSESRRPDIITQAQSVYHPIDPAHYGRVPVLESAQPSGFPAYSDTNKSNSSISRGSIVKVATGPEPVPAGSDDPLRKGKQQPGSITTGMPVRSAVPHEERDKTETILGKRVIVRPHPHASPVSESARLQEVYPHNLRYSAMHHPALMHHSSHSKAVSGPGSILDGTPVVKRKPSEESNSSLSPSANPAPYPTMGASRPSPTVPSSGPKHSERRPPSGPEKSSDQPRGYPYNAPEKMKKEEPYHRRTPDKLVREPASQSSANAPGMRRTPTGHLSQHPAIKKEIPGSPQTTEEMIRRQQPQLPAGYDMYPIPGFPGANPDLTRLGLQHIPLTSPGVSSDLLEIFRQYGRAGGVTGPPVYPLFVPPGIPAGYPGLIPTINPVAPPLAPGSPQNDDTRDVTSKLLNQDFKTAQIMHQLRHPASSTVPGVAPGFPPTALAATGMGMSPLVVTTPGHYHALAQPYVQAAGMPVERINFIPTHGMTQRPFSPHFVQSGRSSTESNRSPSQKPPNAASPDFTRHRNKSGETPREFAHHPAVKGRNSPSSPYNSSRGNISPQRYPTSSQPQLSPTHLQTKPYRHYPPSTSPGLHQRQVSKSPHIFQGMPMQLSYAGHDPSHPIREAHSVYQNKHSRTGSLDGSIMQKRARPDSAGPHMRSLPQSPNDPIEHGAKYSHGRQHTESPKYRSDSKQEMSQPPHLISHEHKMHQPRGERQARLQDDRPSRGESPRPVPKHPSEPRTEARLIQHHQQMLGSTGSAPYHQPTNQAPRTQKRDTHSPYPTMKERVVEPSAMKDHVHPKSESGSSSRNQHEHTISNNPREDLKNCGRTTMKAATFIDHIINLNYTSGDQASTTASSPPHPTEQVMSKQVSDPSKQRRSEQSSPVPVKRELLPSSSRAHEAESQLTSSSRHRAPFVPTHSNQPSTRPGPTQEKEKQQLDHRMTLAECSANVIDQCYRQDKMMPQNRNASPVTKPSVIVTEPISPPEKHLASKMDSKQPPKVALPQYHLQPQRFITPPEARLRPDVRPSDSNRMPVARFPVQPHPSMPGAQPSIPTAGASLEDIIRLALLTSESSSASPSETASISNPLAKGIDMRFPRDMIMSHAALASLPHLAASALLQHGVPPSSNVPPTEERKGNPAGSQTQPQSRSEHYVSALMFRPSSSQNTAPQNAPNRQDQPFYQPPRQPHSMPAASQSPAPHDVNQLQGRQIRNRPQYEELSDSE